MIAPETLARLKEAAGPRGFIDDPEGIGPYCTPFRFGWVAETEPFNRIIHDIGLMRRLKRSFDPANILNPGKLLVPEGG